MRRALKWLLRIVGIVGVIVAILLVVYVTSARSIAERQILATLERMGFDDASVQVQSIGTSRLQVSNLNLGKEAGLRIGAIGVEYAIDSATSVHVETVEVVGAMLDMRWRDGKLDIGPLSQLKMGGDSPRLASDGVPFDTLLLRSSFVMFEWNNLRYAIPAEATLKHKGAGVCDVDARVWVLGVEVPFRGTIDFTASNRTVASTESSAAAADGVRFDVVTPLFGPELHINGFTGSGLPTTLAAVMKSNEGGGVPFELLVDFTHGTESILTLKAQGRPSRLAPPVPGALLELVDTELDGHVQVNLTTGNVTGKIDARAESIAFEAGGTRTVMAGPRFNVPLSGSFADDRFVLAAEPHIAVGFRGVTDNSPDKPLNISTFGMRSSVAEFALLRQPTAEHPNRVVPSLKLWLHSTPLDAKRGDNAVSLGKIAFGANVSASEQDEVIIDAGVTLEGGDVTMPGSELKLSGIHVALPFTMRSESTTKPALHIDSIRFREDVFPAVTGALAIKDGVLAGSAEWPLFSRPERPQIPAKIAASIDLFNGVTGEVSASIKDLRITDDQTIAKLLKATEQFRMTGLLNVDAKLKVNGLSVEPLVKVDAREATFSSAAIDFAATGLSTSVTFNSLSPLTTLPNQRLHMAEGHLGTLNFTNAVLNFRTDAIDAFVLELAGWSVGKKGRFWTHAVRFNPLKPVVETQVFIEDMSVAEWLEILQDGDLEGEGYLYGRLPIRWDPSREVKLTFGEGFLYTKPGKGWIRMSESKEVRQYLFSTLKETLANLQQEAQRRLLEAMNDYEYDTIQFDFIREQSEVLCRVTTKGRGRSGAKQEIGELQVDIHNFGVLLSDRLLRNVGSVGAIDDALRRALGQ